MLLAPAFQGMDRTPEFFSAVEAIRVAEGVMVAARPPNPPGLRPDASDHARFSAAVAVLGKEIHATSLKLQEMAKRESTLRAPPPVWPEKMPLAFLGLVHPGRVAYSVAREVS